MRLATWNIGEDEKNKNGRLDLNSYNYITKTINNERIDIICLQEAIIKSKNLPPIANYIKEHTDLKYIAEFELSDSHINIGSRMGIIICSKYKIDSYENIMLDNPNLIYSVDENTTYYSHDKGFIIANIICGDFNYDNVNSLFSETMINCTDLINCPTRKNKQLDHFIISNKLNCSSNKIEDNSFDHKLGIFEIND